MLFQALKRRYTVDIYIPVELEPYVKEYLTAFHHLASCSPLPSRCVYNLHSLQPGEEELIDKEYVVKTVRCYHSAPTLGYCFSKVKRKLKAEYQGYVQDTSPSLLT